jgi:sporulation protein YlmC with PRC-barrel domain
MSNLNALVCGLALAAAGSATGQEARPTELRKVTQIIGSNVLLQDGVNYGKVEDIVLNEDGCIEYVVVTREDRYALMPWGVATVDYGQRAVIFDVTPQVVQPLFFARDAWPDVADPQFGRRVQDAFGARAVRREVRKESVRPGTDPPRPNEPRKSKVESRPERGPDAPPPRDQPKAKAKERVPDAPPPADQPKTKARAKEKGPDPPPPAEPPKVKAKAKEKSERP